MDQALEINQKGTVIVGQIRNDKVIVFHSALPNQFVMDKINSLMEVPQTRTPYI